MGSSKYCAKYICRQSNIHKLHTLLSLLYTIFVLHIHHLSRQLSHRTKSCMELYTCMTHRGLHVDEIPGRYDTLVIGSVYHYRFRTLLKSLIALRSLLTESFIEQLKLLNEPIIIMYLLLISYINMVQHMKK